MKPILPVLAKITFIVTLLSSFIIFSAKAAGNHKAVAATDARKVATNQSTYPFEFHSGFWINLHHFLYEQALLQKQGKVTQTANSAANPLTQLSSEQQRLWNSAVDYYTKMMIQRDLLFDRDMAHMNDQLAEAEGDADLSKSGLSSDQAKILESVAPIYRMQWWPQHDKSNRFWIAVVTPLVQEFGQRLINQLTAAFKAKWPSDLIRVDVVEYANWAGAYTTFESSGRVHTTMSTDVGNQGFSGLEILFHEASHSMVGPRECAVSDAIARECKAKQKPIPDGLWHAIIFYTVGEITKKDLNEYGVSDYVPVVYRGLFARAWPNLQRPLELYWQPYLDGAVDFDQAMSNLIGAL